MTPEEISAEAERRLSHALLSAAMQLPPGDQRSPHRLVEEGIRNHQRQIEGQKQSLLAERDRLGELRRTLIGPALVDELIEKRRAEIHQWLDTTHPDELAINAEALRMIPLYASMQPPRIVLAQ